MIRQSATILGREGNAVWVECTRGGPCAMCPGRGCHDAFLAGAATRHRLRVRADGFSCEPGTRLTIGIPEGAVLRASLLAYALPLATLLAGVGAGTALAPWGGGAGAVLGLVAGIAVAGRVGRRRPPDPVILARSTP